VKPALFISDLHLCPSRGEIARIFFGLLEGEARQAGSLYILGDLFEYWAGDDDSSDAFNRSVVSALADCASEIDIRLMHGNRDFLIADSFCREAGLGLIADETVIDLFGTPTLLMHGDTLCTEDVQYADFRSRVRSPQWTQSFLAQPLSERRRQIEAMRVHSECAKQQKPADEMDINPAAVADALRRHGCTRLIHGHTHRSARHEQFVDGKLCERIVLADWYKKGSVLVCTPDGCRFEELA
jgi:UDP-2,3-diacylglucosamine hydrolase